jgi:ABC-2 type transport system permease protein
MWNQVLAIALAQLRISRNHLPRTGIGTVLLWLVTALWYGIFASMAVFLAVEIPTIPRSDLTRWLAPGFLCVFLFWQTVPLLTLSSGWSLELKKIQIYPIRTGALFGLETLLRISSAPEMIIVLTGVAAGLLRRSDVPRFAPLTLILFVAFNLFMQLGIRDLILRSFERSRLREVFAVLIISIGVMPQLVLRTTIGRTLKPYFLGVAGSGFFPWQQAASLSLGVLDPRNIFSSVLWTAAAFLFARWTFAKSLLGEDAFQTASDGRVGPEQSTKFRLAAALASPFRDPLSALIEKEITSLVRMPRFRVVYATSCLLGLLIFIPAVIRSEHASGFFERNLVPMVSAYGLLILGETLLLNVFGLDRTAAQIYFAAPLQLRVVLVAKNFVAIWFVLIQNMIIALIATSLRPSLTRLDLAAGLMVCAVLAIFLLTAGNLISVVAARPVDPRETFKKQSSAKIQLWTLGATLVLFFLVGFAFLARYAFHSTGVFFAVLAGEFAFGLIVYLFGLENAVQRGMRDKELLLQALSKSGSPLRFS